MQFSTATLLTVTLLVAVAIAFSQFDSLLIPIAFPFTLGPIAAFRITPTRTALAVGMLSSVFWTLASVVPFGLVVYLFAFFWPAGSIDEGILTRGLFVTATIFYFFGSSLLGGYIGGVVARPD